MSAPPTPVARAQTELAACRALVAGGFPTQAVSRAYYAVFYAAEAALALLGLQRRKHAGLISAFAEHLVRPGEIEPQYGKILQSLFAQRNAADYGAPGATDEDATLAIGDAERFIAAVEAWLAKRESGR